MLLVAGVKFQRFWSCMEACSLSFLLIGLHCGEGRMALDAWSLACSPGVSVFPARSGFTLGWVYFHVGGVAHCCCCHVPFLTVCS